MRIAISGKMCSGKTSCYEYLEYKFKQAFMLENTIDDHLPLQKLSFGKPIKDMYNHMFNTLEKNRNAMQTIGDSFRSIDNDVFANYLVRQCSDNKIYVVDDLRFKNEYDILKKNGFITIRLVVDYDKLKTWYQTLYPNEDYNTFCDHRSEVDLDNETDFDVVLHNPKDYKPIWDYLIENYKKDICKVLYNSSSVDDYKNMGLFAPSKDYLTDKYVHQSCHWHSHRYDTYNKL